ncbi:hypothetical protein, partial [Pseudomonas aeruginosa]
MAAGAASFAAGCGDGRAAADALPRRGAGRQRTRALRRGRRPAEPGSR